MASLDGGGGEGEGVERCFWPIQALFYIWNNLISQRQQRFNMNQSQYFNPSFPIFQTAKRSLTLRNSQGLIANLLESSSNVSD